MRSIPLLTGVLTVAMLGGVGWVLLSEGAWLIGSVAVGFGIFRLVFLVVQIVRWVRANQEEAAENADQSVK